MLRKRTDGQDGDEKVKTDKKKVIWLNSMSCCAMNVT